MISSNVGLALRSTITTLAKTWLIDGARWSWGGDGGGDPFWEVLLPPTARLGLKEDQNMSQFLTNFDANNPRLTVSDTLNYAVGYPKVTEVAQVNPSRIIKAH